jgi:hypothetical protein
LRLTYGTTTKELYIVRDEERQSAKLSYVPIDAGLKGSSGHDAFTAVQPRRVTVQAAMKETPDLIF